MPELIENDRMIRNIKKRSCPVIVYCTEAASTELLDQLVDHQESFFINNISHHDQLQKVPLNGCLDDLMK